MTGKETAVRGTEEMNQQVKHLLRKLEDSHLDPQYSCE